VTGLNPLTNRDFTYADYRIDLAREGGEDPYAGIIVRVKHPGGDSRPVPGALCTLVADPPTVLNLSGTTNSDGDFICPIDPNQFPTSGTNKDKITFTVIVSKGSVSDNPWMMKPNINSITGTIEPYRITAENWRTLVKDIEFEQSAKLIIKVTDKKEYPLRPFDDVKADIKDQLLTQDKNTKYNDTLSQWRTAAGIKIFEENIGNVK
jgi:hypothetical protein